MDTKLIVSVKTLRDNGWPLPRHRIAFQSAVQGVLDLREVMDPALHRHTRCARLLEPDTGTTVPDLPQLLDATWLRVTADEWIIGGLERMASGDNLHDVAQTWLVTPIEVRGSQRGATDGGRYNL
jgi:hypothetical protein